MANPEAAGLERLGAAIVNCELCPRLVRFREELPPRAAFRGQAYWRRPVTGFGDPNAWLLVLGLAPAAHGGNRTGRVFTGDESAKFLMRCLHRAGFANQPTSLYRDDGLRLTGCYMTAAVKCVPPGDRPRPEEFENCRPYLTRELELLTNVTAVLTLGRLAFDSYLDIAKARGSVVNGVMFSHGTRVQLPGMPLVYASYHPSPRNTNTGKLTEAMLLDVLEAIKRDRRSRSVPGAGHPTKLLGHSGPRL